MSRTRIMGWAVGVALGAAVLSAPAALEAQGGDGFLFREPRVQDLLRRVMEATR